MVQEVGFDNRVSSDVQARLGPKAGAPARLEGAQAQSITGPSLSPQWRLGSGSARLRPGLLVYFQGLVFEDGLSQGLSASQDGFYNLAMSSYCFKYLAYARA